MEAIDPEYYKSLCQILEHPLEDLGLDLTFSCEASEFGVVKLYDIVPEGRHRPVTDENKMEYIQKITQVPFSHPPTHVYPAHSPSPLPSQPTHLFPTHTQNKTVPDD